MNKFKITFSFHGRQALAIGITYSMKDTYEVGSMAEAKSLLYEDYEMIKGVSLEFNHFPYHAFGYDGNNKSEWKEMLNNESFIPVRPNSQRERKEYGSYWYTRNDTISTNQNKNYK